MKWTVGQEVFIAKSNNARTTSTARIVKVGRKWATLERVEGRFDLETGMLDGGQCSSLGKVYVNEAEYRTECELNAAWLAFSTKTQCRAPQGITIEAIRAASGTPDESSAVERAGDVERIACAALRDSETGLILCAPRHGGPIMSRLRVLFGRTQRDFEQGFITNKFDRFVNRQEAHIIAKAAGQIRYRCGGDEDTLYSENLY